MPQKVIKFKGINRSINEFQTSGECEELINLRPQIGGGYRVVKNKVRHKNSGHYLKIYNHIFGDVNNIIAVNKNGGVSYITKDGAVGTLTGELSGSELEFSSAGNVIVVYKKSTNKQLVFKYEDNRYSKYEISLKRITDAYVSYRQDYFSAPTNTVVADDKTLSAFNSALNSAASGFHNKLTSGLCGVAVVGCTYELEDGNEIWSTAFVVANSSNAKGYSKPVIDYTSKEVTVTGASGVSLTLMFENREQKGVKKINVYSTRPVFPYEAVTNTNENDIDIKELSLKELDLAGQVMYYQGSVSPDGVSAVLQLEFGSEHASEIMMNVTQGCIERVGNSISYNNRFHYYRSTVEHVIQTPTITRAPSIYDPNEISVSTWIAYVKIEDSWKLVNNKFELVTNKPLDVIYPMAGVKKVAFVQMDDSGSSVPYEKMFYVDLNDSTAYNYSYSFEVTANIVSASSFKTEMQNAGQLYGDGFDKKAFIKKEVNAMNVSSQYNPYVFPVNYSYGFDGEIIDIAASYLPISSTQIGQYPLTVFTTAGVFALEQGNGSVLYSNTTPLQPLVSDGKAVSTPHGAFFMSSNNIYLLSGRDVVNISQVLDGERDLRLRNNLSYQKLCINDNGQFFNYSTMLSRVDFRELMDHATLTYDQFNDELYISSTLKSINYSYVFNFTSNTFHKISKKYIGSLNASRYAIEVLGEDRNIVDMHAEESGNQPILLQSRPMSFDALNTHIQRLILFADAGLSGSQNLCLTVFASDNLYDWKCIISAQKQKTALRQIRTNRAAKSYKDYVILISGTVGTETDISDIIADYTVVNRRLG